ALEGRGSAGGGRAGCDGFLRTLGLSGQGGRMALGPLGRPPGNKTLVGVLGWGFAEPVPDRVMVVEIGPAGEGDLRAGGEQRLGLGAAFGGEEFAAVDHRRGQRTVGDERAGAGTPR